MADNYLEKQMEDFRAGRLGKSVTARRIASATSPLPSSARILAVCPSLEFAEAVLGTLCPSAAKVAAVIPASRQATALTQRLGVRYYPLAEGKDPAIDAVIRDILHNWHSLGLVIADASDCRHSPSWGAPLLSVSAPAGAPSLEAALLAMTLYSLSPDSAPSAFTAPSITLTLTK